MQQSSNTAMTSEAIPILNRLWHMRGITLIITGGVLYRREYLSLKTWKFVISKLCNPYLV